MLKLSNHEEVARRGELIPLIERIALCISSGTRVRAITDGCQARQNSNDWIVYADEQNRGIALRVADSTPVATVLRRDINHVVYARKLVRCFKVQQDSAPLYLQDSGVCPADWHVFRVSLSGGDVLCAASLPCPELFFQGMRQMRSPMKFTVSLQARLEWHGEIAIGSVQFLRRITVTFMGVGIVGCVNFSEEGVMTVVTEGVESASAEVTQQPVQIRVDLGDVELTLAEIAGLRAGAKLELAADFPLKCYLRIGCTTLATGEISHIAGEMQLTLKEMLA
jgi:flagellar motor switch/type III secretory pathway protein FliN